MKTGMRGTLMAVTAVLAIGAASPVLAQAPLPSGTQEQKDAMQRLSWMDGEWSGTAAVYAGPDRTTSHSHTERIGPMVGGSIKVIEGRTTEADGSVSFNAFAVISWDDETDRYLMRSYANGQAGDFPLEVTPNGFKWTTPARGGSMEYVTVHSGDDWVETGDFVMEGRPPMRVIELRLHRRGNTDWPAANPVAP